MDRSRVRTWAIAGSVAAALVSSTAQAQVATGRFEVRLVIVKACTFTPGTPAGAGSPGSAPVSVACSGNVPYSIDTAPADGGEPMNARKRSAQPYSVDFAPLSAAGTATRTQIITVRY